MMTLQELVGIPELRLRVLCGHDELHRSIYWVHPTDMLDPSAYLESGELVLTNGLWRLGPTDSETFVSHLAEAGVHGLAFAVYPDQRTPADLVAACASHGLPLMELSDLPFRAVSEAVFDHIVHARDAEHLHARQFEESLTRAVADGEGITGLNRRLQAETGMPCAVIRRNGMVAAEDWTATVNGWQTWLESVAAIRRRAPTSGGIRLGNKTLFVIRSGGPGRKVPDGYLIVSQRREAFTSTQRSIVAMAVDHFRLEFRRLRAVSVTERRFARELIELIRRGAASDAEPDAHLRALGLDRDEPIIALEASATNGRIDELSLLIESTLGHLQEQALLSSSIVVTSGSTAAALASVRSPGKIHEHFHELIMTLSEALDLPGVAIGLSAVASTGTLARQVLAESRQAHEIAAQRIERPSIASRRNTGSYALLLALTDPQARAAHHANTLGPIVDYDAQHDSQLIATLETFLGNCGAMKKTAERLNVHVNTLRYRLATIEHLTGRDLALMSVRVDFFLALEYEPASSASPDAVQRRW